MWDLHITDRFLDFRISRRWQHTNAFKETWTSTDSMGRTILIRRKIAVGRMHAEAFVVLLFQQGLNSLCDPLIAVMSLVQSLLNHVFCRLLRGTTSRFQAIFQPITSFEPTAASQRDSGYLRSPLLHNILHPRPGEAKNHIAQNSKATRRFRQYVSAEGVEFTASGRNVTEVGLI